MKDALNNWVTKRKNKQLIYTKPTINPDVK